MQSISEFKQAGAREGLTGIILAGGRNRRMGTRKWLLPFAGEAMIIRQISIMRTICGQLIVSANESERVRALVDRDVLVTEDIHPDTGPLGGLHAALSIARNRYAWVVACDMPFLSPQAALLLLSHAQEGAYDAAIPRIDGRNHPLHGIYANTLADSVSALIRADKRSVNDLLSAARTVSVEEDQFQLERIDLRFVRNMNTPEQYERCCHEQEAAPCSSTTVPHADG